MNPRAAVNDLHPFQGCPFSLLGTSPCADSINIITTNRLYLKDSIHSRAPQDCLSESNGEGGIRTHAPFRTNGFQDRLVMTTSISLQTCFSILQDEKHFVKSFFDFFKSLFSLVCCICRISDSSVIIPRHSTDVNTFFTIIFHFLY